jgi:hypothetical protein
MLQILCNKFNESKLTAGEGRAGIIGEKDKEEGKG